jgi:hypothetical protein
MKNPKPGTRNPVPKMNAAARVAAWRTSRNTSDNKGYRPNPRRTPSDGSVWRQKPL